MKSEILNDIAEVVGSVCEVSVEDIRSMCKRSEIVDARCIFVRYCVKFGFPASTVSAYLGRKRVGVVGGCLRNYDAYHKSSLSFRLLCHDVDRVLADKYPPS